MQLLPFYLQRQGSYKRCRKDWCLQAKQRDQVRARGRRGHRTRPEPIAEKARIARFIVLNIFKLITPNIEENKGINNSSEEWRGQRASSRQAYRACGSARRVGAGSLNNQLANTTGQSPCAGLARPQGVALHPSKVHSPNPKSFRGPFKTTYLPNFTVYSKLQIPSLTSEIYNQDGRHAGRCDSILSLPVSNKSHVLF